jgi:hypothetical protein
MTNRRDALRDAFVRAVLEGAARTDREMDCPPRWDGVTPTCPHCWATFSHWSATKIHVKYCQYGATPRGWRVRR